MPRWHGCRAFSTSTVGKNKTREGIDLGDAARDLRFFGAKKQTSVNLQALMETGQGKRLSQFESNIEKAAPGSTSSDSKDARSKVLIQIACFLHRELPVRLAHRALELEKTSIPEIREVCSWYKESLLLYGDALHL